MGIMFARRRMKEAKARKTAEAAAKKAAETKPTKEKSKDGSDKRAAK